MSNKPKKPGRIKAAILDWLGVPIGLTDEAFWSGLGRSEAGQQVNQRSVMQIAAVWRCTRVIADTIASLPLGVYERTSNGRRSAVEHPLHMLLHVQPNADSTAVVFWTAMLISMLLRGNGFAEKQMLGNRLVALRFLYPPRLRIEIHNSKRRYFYKGGDGKEREIPEDRIFRIPGYIIDGDWGVSVIEYGAKVFGSALAASTAANKTFESGLSQTVAFKFPHLLKKEQRAEFREAFQEIAGAVNAGKPALLEGGMEAQTIGINPKDAQLLEARSFSVEEICSWFGVPPSLCAHTEKSTSWGAGLESQDLAFLKYTLRPWLTLIEQSISKDLLSPVERLRYYAEFSLEGLLRADSAGRANYLSTMVNNGMMTRDEARAKENLPPKGGNADVLTVQTALIPIDQLGQPQGTRDA